MTTPPPLAGAAAEPAAESFRPRPRAAALLNLALPGLGQLYNGRPLRAAGTFVAVNCWVAALVRLTLAAPCVPLRLGLVALALYSVVVVLPLDGGGVAHRTRAGPRRPYQRWYALAAAFLVGVFLVQPWLAGLIRRHVVAPLRLTGGSMAPTLLPGDWLFASPAPRDPVRRGDLVVFQPPGPAGYESRYVARVVGLPGDTVAMRDFRLAVNGAPAAWARPHLGDGLPAGKEDEAFGWQRAHLAPGVDSAGYRPTYGTWGPLVVPAGRYFLLGDDVDNSRDSRHDGVVPGAALVGRPAWIYFSHDPATGAVRWRRVGRAAG
jgi:signal peptidase I